MKKIINISLFLLLFFNVAATTPISEKNSLAMLGAAKVVCGAAVYLVGLGLGTGLNVKIYNAIEHKDLQPLTLIPGYIDIYPNIRSYAMIIALTFSGIHLLDNGLKDLK